MFNYNNCQYGWIKIWEPLTSAFELDFKAWEICGWHQPTSCYVYWDTVHSCSNILYLLYQSQIKLRFYRCLSVHRGGWGHVPTYTSRKSPTPPPPRGTYMNPVIYVPPEYTYTHLSSHLTSLKSPTTPPLPPPTTDGHRSGRYRNASLFH